MASFKGFLVGSSLIVLILLSVTEFFSNVSLSGPCGAVVIVVVFILVVVVVSIGLVCLIVECDFALLVVFGLSSVAVVRC